MLAGCANDQAGSADDVVEDVETAETGTLAQSATGTEPGDASVVASYAGVPLIELNNGVGVPQLGLGTQVQALESDASEAGRKLLNDTCAEATAVALQAGYRHLDTAHGYFNEEGVGRGVAGSGVGREEVWITSKLWPSDYDTASQAIDDTLDRLGTGYLDCLYLHHPAGNYVEAWHALEEAYRQGKVRALGISNFDNWPEAFQAIMDEAEIRPQIMQIECHPFAQRIETRQLAAQYDMQVECWYPLGHADPNLLQDPTITTIAAAHGKTAVQVILRWHMQEGLVAVPGSTNPDHIRENLDIFDFELSEDEMDQMRSLDKGEAGRYFNIDYRTAGVYFLSLNE